jgi:crossover junction endodeoxyribonuclease RusA
MTARTITLPWPPACLSPNARMHRAAKAAAVKHYRKRCRDAAFTFADLPLSGRHPVALRLTFCPPNGRARDDDNMLAAFKSGRDGLAEGLGVDDALFRLAAPVIGDPIRGGCVVAEIEEIPA